MRFLSVLITVFYLCSSAWLSASDSSNVLVEKLDHLVVVQSPKIEDSIVFWVSTDYEKALNENNSICECWSKSRFNLLYIDSVHSKITVLSNLKHFGHDSEFYISYSLSGNTFLLDSTYYDSRLRLSSFVLNSNDELTLYDDQRPYSFRKIIFKFEKEPNGKWYPESELSDYFYEKNSELLLKYNSIDTLQSTHDLISIEELHELIESGKVHLHCSDDFGYDGMTLHVEPYRYFHLEFRGNEVILYDELEGRGRYEKLDYSLLPKQVLRITGD